MSKHLLLSLLSSERVTSKIHFVSSLASCLWWAPSPVPPSSFVHKLTSMKTYSALLQQHFKSEVPFLLPSPCQHSRSDPIPTTITNSPQFASIPLETFFLTQISNIPSYLWNIITDCHHLQPFSIVHLFFSVEVVSVFFFHSQHRFSTVSSIEPGISQREITPRHKPRIYWFWKSR